MADSSLIGLLYQKGKDSKNFPLTEIKQAIPCFLRRRDLAAFEPAVVHIRPDHQDLIRIDDLREFDLDLEFNAQVPRFYIWLVGRPKANGYQLELEAEDTEFEDELDWEEED
jgi:hypothetical protein